MALDIKVKATLSEKSIETIKNQLEAAGKSVRLKFTFNKNELQNAVNNAIKELKPITLTVAKVKFSEEAQKALGGGALSQGETMSQQQIAYLKQVALLQKQQAAAEREQIRVKNEKLNTELKELQVKQKQINLSNQQARAEKELTGYQRELFNIKKQTGVNSVQAWMQKNTKSVEKYRDEYERLIASFITAETPEQLRLVNAEFTELRKRIEAAGDAGLSFGDKFKKSWEYIKSQFSAFALIREAVNLMKEAYQNIKNIDTAMVELKKVTDESDKSYSDFLSRSGDNAKQLGRTISGLVEQTAAWAKLGFGLEEAEELAKISAVYSNVGDLDDETAVSDLVSIQKAYAMKAEDTIQVVDELNELGNNFATDAASLGDGLSKSASALNVAGNSLEQSIAMLTGMTEITQNASAAGNSLKVISLRIRGMAGALQELGEESEGVESISKIQTQILNLTHGKVNIFDANKEFRSTYDILKDISEVYNSLASTEKASLTEILFGKVRANQGVALINAFQSGQVEKAFETAMNAEGSAYKEQAKWLDSIDAKTQQLTASAENLSNVFLNTDMIKGFLDAGIVGLDILTAIVDKAGTLPLIFSALVTGSKIKKFIQGLGTDFKELTVKQQALTISTGILKSALTGLGIAFAGWAISKIVSSIEEAIVTAKELHENVRSLINSAEPLSEETTSLDSSIKKYEELRQKIKEGNLSEKEFSETKSQLLDLQNSLIDTYGDEVDSISLVNGEYEEQLNLLRELKKEKYSDWLNENRAIYNDAIKDQEKQGGYSKFKGLAFTWLRANRQGSIRKFLEENDIDISKLFENTNDAYLEQQKVLELLNGSEKDFYEFNDDAQEALDIFEEKVTSAVNANREIYKEYQKNKQWIDEYERIAALASDNSDLYTTLSNNIDALNNAAENFDQATILETYKNIFANEEILKEVYDTLSDEVKNAFDNLFEGINKEAISKSNKFNRIVSSFITGNNNIKGIDVSDYLSGSLNGYSDSTIKWFTEFKKVVADSGLQLSDFTYALKEVGIVAGTTIEESEEAFKNVSESVNTEITNIATLNEVLSSSGTLTTEQYTKVLLLSREYLNALRYEADGIRLDSRQINQLSKQRIADTRATVKQAQAQEKLNFEDWHKKIKNAIGDYRTLTKEKLQSIQSDLIEANTISNRITQYDLLISQLDEAASAFNNYTKAKSEAEYGAQFDIASDAYKSITQGFETSKIGTKEFEAAVDALVPESVIEQGVEAIYNYYRDTLGRYFVYDDSGNILRESLENFVQDGIDKGLFSGELSEWSVNAGVKLQDIADRLNLTKDSVISFFGALEEYGYGVDFTYFDEFIESLGDDVIRLQQLEDQLLASGDIEGYVKVIEQERKAANNIANGLLDQEQILEDLEEANQKLQTMIDTGATESELTEQINHIQELKNKLIEPSEINITIAKNEIDTQIAELKQELQEVMFADDSVASIRNAEEIRAQISELEGKKTELEAMLKLDTSEAEESIKEIKSEITDLNKLLATSNTISIDTLNAQRKLNNLITLMRTFRNLTSTTLSVDTNGSFDDKGNTTGGPKGFAQGTMGSDYSGTALVGELGAEMRVRGNSWQLLGARGAEFTDVRKGDIIFDAAQTRHLLSSGKINSRGRSFVNGTTGRAFVQGGSGFTSWGGVNNDVAEAINNAADAIEDAADKSSDYIDEIEILISRIDTQIKRLESIQELYETYRNQNSVIDKNIALQLQKQSTEKLAYDKYMRKANSVDLSQDWVEKVKSGGYDITEITDEDLKKKIDEFKEWYEKAEATKDSLLDISKTLHDLSVQKLENITNDFELVTANIEAVISKQQAVIALNEKIGKTAKESDYKDIVAEQRDITNYLAGELEQVEKELSNQISSGAIVKYDDCWWEWNTNIENIRKNLAESESSLQDIVETIRQIRWKPFTDAITDLDDLESELKDVQSLIGKADLFDEFGKLTSAGTASLGLYVQQLSISKKRSAEYTNAIKALDGDLKNGNISQEKYNELLKQYTVAQRKAVADTKAAEDAIISLRIQGIDKATESYKKYIDIQKEDLKAKKEYDEQLDKINDKNDEMNAIRSQISALQGDEKNATKIKKLNSQLLKLQDEYNDLRKDHEYEMLVEGYDKDLELFQQNQEAEKALLESDLEYRQGKIDESAEYVKGSYDDVYQYLQMLGDTYGEPITEQLTNPWSSAQEASKQYESVAKDVLSNISIEISKINKEIEKAKNTTAADEKAGGVEVGKVSASTTTTTTTKTTTTPSTTPSGSSNTTVENAPYITYELDKNETPEQATKEISKKTGIPVKDIEEKNKNLWKNASAKGGGGGAIRIPLTSRAHYSKSAFASGGIIEMAHRLGEDGIAFVRNGEAIIAPDQVSAVKALAENASKLNTVVEKLEGSSGGTINISYGSLINEYNASMGENSREVTQLFRKLFDNEMKRMGNYSRQLGLI